MIKSMTGFGRNEKTINDKTFLVEIKSLNGKQFDINLKIPALLKPFEFEIRNLIQETLLRGSVECTITIKQNGTAKAIGINTSLIETYYQQLKPIADQLDLKTDNLLSAILKLPEVAVPNCDILDPNDWPQLREVIRGALTAIDLFRMDEGKSLEGELRLRIQNINRQEKAILRLEPLRREKIKENILQSIDENIGKENYDKNRFEQELIYYIEKIDIREEQVRLRNHCEYFLSIVDDEEALKGKKLGFVVQEIGREINTTGSKAYDSEIQKCVVLMKDELEKLKEQIFNVL